jgi:cytochrome c553
VRRAALLICVVLGVTGAANARAPDLAQGRAVALGGGPSDQQACAACHGANGEGTMPIYPRLAGQAAFYLYKQLLDFRSGERESAVMGPIAQRLSPREMEDVAGFYAAATAPYSPPAGADGAQLQEGGTLAAVGSSGRNIQSCANCHGQAGRGMPPSFPYLAGQSGVYLASQLAAFRQGSRRNDPLNVMGRIAGQLNESDIAALVAYFAHVYPPGWTE